MYYSFSKNWKAYTNKLITNVSVFQNFLDGRVVDIQAIWDTGATQSVMTNHLMENLNFIPISSKLVFGVNSKQYVDIVAASIKLPNEFVIKNKRFYVCDLPPGIDMLIGMDIIQLGDFLISNKSGKTQFSFVIPSLPDTYNLADEAAKLNRVIRKL
jgi:hypothetical protein